MKRPLLPVALLFIGGILSGEWVRPPLPLLFGFSFAAVIVALAWERGRLPLLALLIVLTGWTDAVLRGAILAPRDLRAVLGENVAEAILRGTLRAPPAPRVFDLGGKERWHSSAVIAVSEMARSGKWEPASGKVIATTTGTLSQEFFEGQRVEVRGVIRPPRGPQAAGLFDARAYYQRQGVFYQLQTEGTNDWSVAPGADLAAPVAERFRRWARETLTTGLPAQDEPLQLTWTLLLDWKAPLTDAVEEPFMRAGTFHIFAVDGLRIGLLSVIVLGLLRFLRIPRAICGLIVVPALWFYVGLTGWPASAIRAAIMASVVIFGWTLRRPGDVINSLCAAGLLILLWDPGQLFQPGFQLSFLVVICIALILPLTERIIHAWLFRGDPFLPDTLQPRLPPLLHQAAVYGVDVFALSLAAWIGSIPLAAWYFHLFTPASVPANCVVVPVTALALMGGIGSLLVGAWLPGVAALLNNATWALMSFIINVSDCAAHSFNVASPSLAACVLYYAVIFLVFTGWIFRSRHKWLACAALFAASVACIVHWAVARQTAHISILPLRGAPAVFVDAPAQMGTLLLDCGDTEEAAEVVKPFLCARGVNHLDAFCVAVGLRPHFDGAQIILTNFYPRGIFTNAAPDRSAAYRELLDALRQSGRCRTAQDGDTIAGWTVLHPGATDQWTQADDSALVLRGEIQGHSILLLPALARDGQNALMRRHPNLRAEIVVAGLPMREEPLCDPLLDLLQPRLIVIMDTQLPATRRASANLRARLARRPAQMVYCRDNGALTLDLARKGWAVRAASGQPAVSGPPVEASGERENDN
jgi:competence protein ComEC